MNFTKDIYLNTDKICENTSLIILYSGSLTKQNDNKIYLCYGYNDTWDRKDEVRLKKTENGYLGVIRVSAGSTFQFVFRDGNNNYDNNNSSNYILPITEKEDTILEFGPNETESSVEDSEKSKDILGASVYSSDSVEFDNTYSVQNSTIPENTLVNKLSYDSFTNTYFVKKEIIKEHTSLINDIDDEFENILEMNKKEVAVEKGFSNAIPKVSETPDFDSSVTSMAMVKSKVTKPTKRSSLYILRKRIKLAMIKLSKLLKSALNYGENNN